MKKTTYIIIILIIIAVIILSYNNDDSEDEDNFKYGFPVTQSKIDTNNKISQNKQKKYMNSIPNSYHHKTTTAVGCWL
jgi:hypothetical protein